MYEKCQVSTMYCIYVPSATQASTHMPTHCTAPWVGGSTAPPSPPTAGPVGKGQKVCPTREEPCSHMRWEGGSIANSLRLRSWICTSAHKVKTHMLSTGVMYCSTLHLRSITARGIHTITSNTSNHTPLAVSNPSTYLN